jgi:hypothetical protein
MWRGTVRDHFLANLACFGLETMLILKIIHVAPIIDFLLKFISANHCSMGSFLLHEFTIAFNLFKGIFLFLIDILNEIM